MAVTAGYTIVTTTNEFQANTSTTGDQRTPDALGLSGGGYVVANNSDRGVTGGRVVLDFYDAAGNHAANMGGDTNLISNAIDDPTLIELANGNVVVIWEDDSAVNPGVYARFFTSSGSPLDDEFSLMDASTTFDMTNAAALSNGGFVVSYEFQGQIYFRTYDASGTQIVDFTLVNTTSTGTQNEPTVTALVGGGFAVGFVDVNNSNSIETRIFENDGTARTGQITVDAGNAGNVNGAPAAAALNNGNYALVYTDTVWSSESGTNGISLVVRNSNGGTVWDAHVNTGTPTLEEVDPDVTVLANGFIVVTWTHPFSGSDNDIYGAIFNESGSRIQINGLPQFTITNMTSDNTASAVSAMLNGEFVTVWEDSIGDGDGDRITAEINKLVYKQTGDAADDIITGDARDETIDGGGGNNTYDLFGQNGDVVINLTAATDQVTGASTGTDQLTNIQNIISGTGNDILTGDANANIIDGENGNNTITGGGGADELYGDIDNDTFLFANGDVVSGEIIDGGDGTNTIRLTDGFSTFVGATISNIQIFDFGTFAANRSVQFDSNQIGGMGIAADAEIRYGAGDFRGRVDINLFSSTQVDLSQWTFTNAAAGDISTTIRGENSADTITGSSVSDSIQGNGGADVIRAGLGVDSSNGGDGDDTLQYASGEVASGEIIDGGNDDDTIQLLGGDINFSGASVTSIEALEFASGSANTTATFNSSQIGSGLSSSAQIIDDNNQFNQINIFMNGPALDLSNWTFSGGNPGILINGSFSFQALNITGSTISEDIDGGDGADIIDGGLGQDLIDGGAGDDRITYDALDNLFHVRGGADIDTLVVSGGSAPFSFDLAAQEFEHAEHSFGIGGGAAQRDTYNDVWQRTDRTIYEADGSRSETIFDPTNGTDTVQIDNNFDTEGNYVSQTGFYDNGGRWAATFDNPGANDYLYNYFDSLDRLDTTVGAFDDGRTFLEDNDQGNLNDWTNKYAVNTAANEADYQYDYYDDGTRSYLEHDQDGVEIYLYQYTFYDASNVADYYYGKYNDGTDFYFDL